MTDQKTIPEKYENTVAGAIGQLTTCMILLFGGKLAKAMQVTQGHNRWLLREVDRLEKRIAQLEETELSKRVNELEEKAARLNQRLLDARLEHEEFNQALSQLSFLSAAQVLRGFRAVFATGVELPLYLTEHYRAAYQAYQRGEEQLGKDTADMEREFAHLPADDEGTEDGLAELEAPPVVPAPVPREPGAAFSRRAGDDP